MSHTMEKECHCLTCDRWFHYLGIAAHRASHRNRNENCEITYTDGDTYAHCYGSHALTSLEKGQATDD